MILLVTHAVKGGECAAEIQEITEKRTHLVVSLAEATRRLREQPYELVLLDQCMVEGSPEDADILFRDLDAAMPLLLNFALSGKDRIIREVRAALLRRTWEVVAAKRSVEEHLRNDLSDVVTALLLSCEMALQVNEVPEAARVKLHAIDTLACAMKVKLDSAIPN
jgi:hypothetical protein